MFEQYEVWYQDGRSRRMWVIYTMAHSFKEARENTGRKPVDCRKRIMKGVKHGENQLLKTGRQVC